MNGYFLLFWIFVSLFGGMLHAGSLAELDSIVAEARDLTDFLAPRNRLLRERYLAALKEYYPDERFTSEAFDALLDQLKILNTRVPGFGARLWETTNLGEKFTYSVAAVSHGRWVRKQAWEDYLNRWQIENLKTAAPYYLLEKSEDRLAKLKEFATDLTKKIEDFEEATAREGLSKREVEQANAEYFPALRSHAEFQAAAAYVLHRFIGSSYVRDQLNTGDADSILNFLKELDQRPHLLLADQSEGFPKQWLSLLKPLIPKVADLVHKSDLFPKATRRTEEGKELSVSRTGMVEYDFVPLPRRIHGIWKGIPLKECIGGECKRLATIALEGTQLSMVEKLGRPLGFIQMVPGKIGTGIYGSVDFGAPALTGRLPREVVSSTDISTNLYEAWLHEISPRLPKSWSGLVVGTAKAINNAGVLPIVHDSASYRDGQKVGLGKEFVLLDPMAKAIAAIEEVHPTEHDYGRGMIFDATVKGNQDAPLVRLDPTALRTLPDPRNVRRPGVVGELGTEEVLSTLLDHISLARFLELTAGTRIDRAKLLRRASVPTKERLRDELARLKLPVSEVQALGIPIVESLIEQSWAEIAVRNSGRRSYLPNATTLAMSCGVCGGAIGQAFVHAGMGNSYAVAAGVLAGSALGGAAGYMRNYFRQRENAAEFEQFKQNLTFALSHRIPVGYSVLAMVDERGTSRCRRLASLLRR